MNRIYIEIIAPQDNNPNYILRLDEQFTKVAERVWSVRYKAGSEWLLFNWGLDAIEFVRLIPAHEIPIL